MIVGQALDSFEVRRRFGKGGGGHVCCCCWGQMQND